MLLYVTTLLVIISSASASMHEVDAIFNTDLEDEPEYRALFASGDMANAFNTSIAFTIPLFSFTLPQGGEGSIFQTLESQAVTVLATLAFLVLGSIAILPSLYSLFGLSTSGRSYNGMDNEIGGEGGIAEYIVSFIENSLDNLPNTNGEDCVKRSICEAHDEPQKYGFLALPFQIFFPPMDINDEYSGMSKYYKAALYGRSDTADCSTRYRGCLFNILDPILYLFGIFFGL